MSTALRPRKSTAQAITHKPKHPGLRLSSSRTYHVEGRHLDLIMLLRSLSSKNVTLALRRKRLISEVQSFLVDSLFDKSSLTHISISQASLRHHPIISATSLPTFITPRTPSSPARLDPMTWSLVHSPHPSYPRCTLTWETQTWHPQRFHPSSLTYIICATTVKTTGRLFTILRGWILQLVGPVGRSRCHRYHRPKEIFLPIHTPGSVLFLVVGSIRASLQPRLIVKGTLSTSSGPTRCQWPENSTTVCKDLHLLVSWGLSRFGITCTASVL